MGKRLLTAFLVVVAILAWCPQRAKGDGSYYDGTIQVKFNDNLSSNVSTAFYFIDDSDRGVAHFVYGARANTAPITVGNATIMNANAIRSTFSHLDVVVTSTGLNSREVARIPVTLGTTSSSATMTIGNFVLVDIASGAPLGLGRYELEYWGYNMVGSEAGEKIRLEPAGDNGLTGSAHVPITPSVLTVHFRPVFSGSTANLKPKLNDSNLEFFGYIHDRTTQFNNYNPLIDIIGGELSSYNVNNGQFSVRIAQVSKAGAGALALTFDGVIVYAWDVEPGPFPALRINPGIFRTEEEQSILITPYVNDYYYNSYNLDLIELENNRFSVELTGVPIYSNSLTRYNFELSEYTNPNSIAGMETRRKVVFDTGNDLSYNGIRFASSGTLKITIRSEDGNYISQVDLPVERSGNNDGLIGAPPYLSYAGEAELNMRFSLPSGRPVREYNGTVTVTGQDPISVSRSSENSFFYEMEAVTFNMMGRGSVAVRVSTVDSEYDSRSWSREFNFARPTITLSHTNINLDDEMSLTVFLRDPSGNAINNGTVYIDGVGSRTSSGNGEYRFSSYKWSTPGYRRIQAYGSDGTLLADFSKLLYVKPPELLTLQCYDDTVMANAEHTIRATVTDEQGRELTSARVLAFVDGATTPIYSVWNAANREYTIRVNAQETVVLRAESSDGRRVSGEIELTAANPEISSNLSMLTANYMERLVLSFLSPTGQPLSGTVALRGQNLQVAERNIRGIQANGNSTASKTGVTVEIDIYCRPLTGTAVPMLLVDFTYGGRTYRELLTIPIGEAKINVTPTRLMAGISSELSLEVVGASGKGISGVPVEFQGATVSSSGTTNIDGKVNFRVTPASTVTEYILEVTRTDSFVQTGNRASKEQVKVPVDKDTSPPVISITNLGASNYITVEEDNFTFSITVTDDVALDTLFINTVSIPLSGTSETLSEAVMLSPGDNQFAFSARDKANNVSARRDITIRYNAAPPTAPPTQGPPTPTSQPILLFIDRDIVMQGGQVMTKPPRNPTTINGRTMLPFRYLIQTLLGGTVDYVELTESITAYIGGNVVNMVVGDNVIYVNGRQVILDQPPVEIEGTTLVPLRAFESVVTRIDWDPVGFVATIYP